MFERWDLVELDLHDVFGVDLDEPGLMHARPWRWLRARVLGLLTTETRLARALTPPEKQPQQRRG